MTTDRPAFVPLDGLAREEQLLAPYAMRCRLSRGRRHAEEPHPFRTLYQRDRDRIVHSTAFRRLMCKTQVLVAQTNDHHRTRLTHTLEVAQISRTIARRLGLNEDVMERTLKVSSRASWLSPSPRSCATGRLVRAGP
jgi:dGTPase